MTLPYQLTPAQHAFRTWVTDTAQRVVAPGAAERDRTHEFPAALIAELGQLGLMGLLVPPEHGGHDKGFVSYCLATEALAAADAGVSTTVHVHSIGGTLLLARAGTDAQKRQYLPAMASGQSIGSFLLTEPGTGSDAAAIQTEARRDGDHFVINGHKHLITNGQCAGTVLVWAVTDRSAGKKGITAFIVPTATPGYRATRIDGKLGQHSSETADVRFEDCRVHHSNVLGDEGGGLKMAMSALADGRIAVAAQAVGIASAAYDAALAYAKTRVAFGQPIIRQQAVAFRLADMATQLEVSRSFYLYAAALREAGHNCIKEAAMAKLYASEMAEKVCSQALQIHGGNGYLSDHAVERYYRDVRVTQIYEGTSDIQRLIIGRDIAQT